MGKSAPTADDNPATPAGLLGDWWATYLPVRPKHQILAVNGTTRLAVLLPAAPLATLPHRFLVALRERLEALAVAPVAIQREMEAAQPLHLVRSRYDVPGARSTIATMRQFEEYLGYDQADGRDPSEIALRLGNELIGPLEYRTPRDVARELLDSGEVHRESGMAHQLLVTLVESDPPIWRRLLVPSGFTLARLHHAIQAAFAWEDYHLHAFYVGGQAQEPEQAGAFVNPHRRPVGARVFGEPSHFDEPLDHMERERGITLLQAAPSAGDVMLYVYDFGDDWRHQILVEELVPQAERLRRPMCLGGAGVAPPEDCGGIWRFQEEILPALASADSAEALEMDSFELEAWQQWAGPDFDPVAVDIDAVQQRMDRRSFRSV